MGPWTSRRAVAPSRYYRMMEEEAKRRRLRVSVVLSKYSRRGSRARFAVWRALKLMGYSFPGIAAIGGYDHTSIMHGVSVINREEPLAVGIDIAACERSTAEASAERLVAYANDTKIAA